MNESPDIFKIVITQEGGEHFRYEQLVQGLDVKAIFDIANKKPRATRKDAGVPRKGPVPA